MFHLFFLQLSYLPLPMIFFGNLFYPLNKSESNKINIGTAGGMTRLSTGYTFLNIQEHSKFIRENLENLTKDELKNFIRHRVNTKMADLGLSPIIPAEEIDKGALKTMKWFDAVIAGKQQTDFFANRVTNYSKGHLDWSAAF